MLAGPASKLHIARRIPQALPQVLYHRQVYLEFNRMSHSTTPDASVSRLARRIPPGTWDTHMHVVEPDRFPLDAKAQYKPSAHTLEQANAFLNQINIQKMVIVQPSIYGNDNSCTLAGLQQLGPKKGRAVIQFDPKTITQAQLQEWHDLGARGVRLNFKSVGANPSKDELQVTMREYADAVRFFKTWALELYISMENVPMLEPAYVKSLGVKIIIDHYGHPTNETLSKAQTAQEVPGFDALVSLMNDGNTWVKLSAGYRLSKDPNNALVKSLCQEILKARADRCVFATDWPHTRFEHLLVGEYLEQMLDWCEEMNIDLEQVLAKNADVLFDAEK